MRTELVVMTGSATITCILAETQGQAEKPESFIVETAEDCRYAMIGGRWHG